MTKTKKTAAEVTAEIITRFSLMLLEVMVSGDKWVSGLIHEVSTRLPRNALTGKVYRGANFFYLLLAGGSPSGLYVTAPQTKKLGGHIKKGAKSLIITFWKFFTPKKDEDDEDEEDEDGKKKKSSSRPPILKVYHVFRIEDTTLSIPEWKEREKAEDYGASYPEIERFLRSFAENTGLKIEESDTEDTAYYKPSTHKLHISKRELYVSPKAYYGTFFHEEAHSTGKALKRDNLSYDEEEIVAELSSVLLSLYFGIETEGEQKNSAVYVNGWSKKLKDNPKWLFYGAQRAQKAVDFMLEKAGFPPFSEKLSASSAKKEEVA